MSVELPFAHFQLRFSKPALYHEGHTDASRLFLKVGRRASIENRIKTPAC